MKAIFSTLLFASTFASLAQAQTNVIEAKTIDVSFAPDELSLTCRMGMNGLSYISLNAPALSKALNANVRLKDTALPVLHLTSPFNSTNNDCQETNLSLTKFIVASGAVTTAHIKLSLVESTLTSYGVTYRTLEEEFVVELNEQLKFYNSASILLEKKDAPH